MANNYGSNPIYLDTDMAAGWRSLQQMNVGNIPSTAQQVSGSVTRQWGFWVKKLSLTAGSAPATGTLLIVDPNDATVLYKAAYPSMTEGESVDFEIMNAAWRDFKVTGITAAAVVQIWYRA